MPLSSLPRGPRTVLVGMGLIAIYVGYSQLTSTWLNVPQKPQQAATATVPHEPSPVFTEMAKRWFPEDPWVNSARGHVRDGGRLLFFEDHKLFNDNRSIQIKPVALLWQKTKDETPITATADSAQLDASTKFSFEEGQFGKITSGLLSGVVRITGPDGLRLEGRTFHISDDAMRVWTRQPVKFGWGDHSGVADGGAEIDLLSSGDDSQAGLLSVSDVQRIRLLGRITCRLMFKEQDSRREPVHLTISAANGFDFFVPTKEATFFGFMDREVRKDNQILIDRPTVTGGLDRLFCSKLVLQLQPKISDDPTAKPSSQLCLVSITAEGRPVIFHSSDQKTIATMSMLTYHIAERRVELIRKATAATGRTNFVEIHQEGSKLTAANVMVAHDDQNQITRVECRGAGTIGPSERRSDHIRDERAIDASWTESLILDRTEVQRVTLRGQVNVTQTSSGMSLAGSVVDMLLAGLDGTSPRVTQADKQSGAVDISGLRPEKLVATGDVKLVSDELAGTAREKLTVTFTQPASLDGAGTPTDPGTTGSVIMQAAAAPGQEIVGVSTADPSSMPNDSRLSGSTNFTSDTIEATVGVRPDGHKRRAEFSDVWLKGDVNVTHTSADDKQSFRAEGNVLFAGHGFQGSREISLFGDPARVVNESNRIEGQRIDLNELEDSSSGSQREAKVEGSGRIRLLVDRGFDGRLLDRASPLDVYWGDRMTFSGRTAHFVGNIRAIMHNETDHDVELTCAGLKVHFADAIQLEQSGREDEFRVVQSPSSSSPSSEIERIECESRVVVNIKMMKNGIVESQYHAEFSDLEYNRRTGAFRATGPGLVESTQPDTGKQLTTSPRAVARANTPVKTPEKTFVFVHAAFIGMLEGNQVERFVQLKQHVTGVFGPVRQLGDRLNIDGLSVDELSEKTGWLGCENLSFSVIPGNLPNLNSFSMVAESNSSDTSRGTRTPCRLESQQFSGDADRITYDHSKQQFILRADEGRQANVSYRPDGGEPQRLTGRSFHYYRDRNQLNANEITGVQGNEL